MTSIFTELVQIKLVTITNGKGYAYPIDISPYFSSCW